MVTESLNAIALIRACSQRAPTGIRNRALIAVLWRCGLRVSEALCLELRDLDLQAGTPGCVTARATRAAPSASTSRPLRCLPAGLTASEPSHPAPAPRCSYTLDGGRIDSSYVRRLLPRLARKAGISRRVHPHGLRHTYAAELARERTSINIIRDALGPLHPRNHRPLPTRRRPRSPACMARPPAPDDRLALARPVTFAGRGPSPGSRRRADLLTLRLRGLGCRVGLCRVGQDLRVDGFLGNIRGAQACLQSVSTFPRVVALAGGGRRRVDAVLCGLLDGGRGEAVVLDDVIDVGQRGDGAGVKTPAVLGFLLYALRGTIKDRSLAVERVRIAPLLRELPRLADVAGLRGIPPGVIEHRLNLGARQRALALELSAQLLGVRLAPRRGHGQSRLGGRL